MYFFPDQEYQGIEQREALGILGTRHAPDQVSYQSLFICKQDDYNCKHLNSCLLSTDLNESLYAATHLPLPTPP